MKKFLLILLFLSSLLFANEAKTTSSLADANKTFNIEKLAQIEEVKEKVVAYLEELRLLEDEISQEKVWMKSYASYLTSVDVMKSLKDIKKRIAYLKKRVAYLKKRNRLNGEQDELDALIAKEEILTSQIAKLDEKDNAPFSKLLTPPVIDEAPEITNPFDIFVGLSMIKTLNSDYEQYLQRQEELTELVSLLRQENRIYNEIIKLEPSKTYENEFKEKAKQLERFETALDTMRVAAEVYQKRLEIVVVNINKDVQEQIIRLVNIGTVIFVVLVIFFLLKLVIKKYITDNERFYTANKVITFINVTIIILILFFNYIDNVNYLVTILGFASAGIAIAMKDWFMSILGWMVIVFGGSIHVGDRIRVDMDGMRYVGDVMDISLLRMTILEDITLTSVMENRRAGRIIFVPNNYIFTRMIANYTHSSLKTVWDGVKITITFDSNHKKAMYLAKEITKKYSKGYTDITRKQLNKLRNQYSLKNTNVEPRIFSFIESNGLNIESWYLTNAYATLTLRSVISTEIVDAFNKEKDITIAYPTQKLHIQEASKGLPFDANEVI